MNFLTNIKLTRVENAAVAGVTTLTSDVIDMKGFDGVTFVATLGAVLTNALNVFQAQHSDVGDGSGMTNVAGSSVATAASAGANKLLVLEIARPTKRFLRVTLTRTIANTVLDSITAFQNAPAEAPVTQDVSVLLTDFALSPV